MHIVDTHVQSWLAHERVTANVAAVVVYLPRQAGPLALHLLTDGAAVLLHGVVPVRAPLHVALGVGLTSVLGLLGLCRIHRVTTFTTSDIPVLLQVMFTNKILLTIITIKLPQLSKFETLKK